MAERLEAIGRSGGVKWDDGSDHDGVANIFVRGGLQGIEYMEFEYVKNGQPEDGQLFGIWNKGFTERFKINHLNNEYLESVEGYYDEESGFIKALQFKTNFRVSEIIGYEIGANFSLSVKGKSIIGFHGYKTTLKHNVISLGAYFTWITPSRLEAKGGKGGEQWDDGTDHEGVTNIYVRGGFEGIQYIKFDYVKDGQPKVGSVHVVPGRGFTQLFEIDHLNSAHLVSVEGYYDDVPGVIRALQFKTNTKTSELMGFEKGKKFILADKGNKIIGFHGYTETNLNSLGAYFTTVPLTKSKCYGGTGGISWDDGVFIGIKKVYVCFDSFYVRCIKFDYIHGRRVVKRQHWVNSDFVKEFELDYPNELITSVKGTFKRFNTGDTRVTSLILKTSKGRTSLTFGAVSDLNLIEFTLESKGCALVGSHGRFDSNGLVLCAIGAYFYPMPPPSTVEKLEAQGCDRGTSWDDGVLDGVRKLYVGQCDYGVAFLKVVYEKDTQIFIGDDHGNKTLLEVKEFELEFPSEYITHVEGCYDKVNGGELEVITMLRFKTNKRTSISVGYESNSSFVLHNECYKIVGFHGKSSNMIHQLGAHFVPI